MIEQLKTIRHHLEPLKNNSGVRKALEALDQIEKMVGEQEPVAWCPALTYPGHEKDRAWSNGKPRKEDIEYWTLNGKGITYAYAAPVAQQPHEIEVQCPVCSHKFYEWPGERKAQQQYEAGDMASAHNDGFRAGVASVTQQPQAEPDMRKVCEALGFDPTNHHNAAKCPYCRGQQPQAEAVPAPEFTDSARAALLWVLWHHQGGGSKVGQPIRCALGMGQFDRLNEHQLREAKRWGELQGQQAEAVPPEWVPISEWKWDNEQGHWLGKLIAAQGAKT